jgi:serine/threonine-protein kinase
MDFPFTNLSSFHSELLQSTMLGQLCGKDELFRDRYQISRILGRGGFGVTFLAKDYSHPDHPNCVIKLLCPKVSSESALETAKLRFEREAKILSKLGHHEQIPTLIDYFVMAGEFYLVQEYIQGGTLARLIRRHGPLSEAAVRQFLREMLPLLHYIHSNQVIHRDLKPQNIIRCPTKKRLVLIDFGAVKELIAHMDEGTCKGVTTHFVGTVGFAPPEQFSLRPVYSSDLYALGVTCLYLLSGIGPLDLDVDRHTGKFLWHDRIKVSEELSDILDKMLHPSHRERFASARSILVALNGGTENLFDCLAAPPPGNEEEPEEVPGYQAPSLRDAIAIRDWKKRQKRDLLRNSSQG